MINYVLLYRVWLCGSIDCIQINIRFKINNQSRYYSISIILKMKSLLPPQKSSKTLSKMNKINRDRNPNSQKQLKTHENKSRLDILEHALEQQIQARQTAQQKLFDLIQHLQTTKKSKIPIKYEKITSKKFISPNKTNPRLTKDNQTSCSYQKQQQVEVSGLYLKLDETVANINRKFEFVSEELDRIDRNIGIFEESMRKMERDHNGVDLIEKKMSVAVDNLSERLYEIVEKRFEFERKNQAQLEMQIKNTCFSKQNGNILSEKIWSMGIAQEQIQKRIQEILETNSSILKSVNHQETYLSNQLQAISESFNTLIAQQNTKNTALLSQTLQKQCQQHIDDLKQSLLVSLHSQTVKSQQKIENLLNDRLMGEMIQMIEPIKHITTNIDTLHGLYSEKLEEISELLQQKVIKYLQNLGTRTEYSYDRLEKEVKSISSAVIETKQSIETVFYGESRSKQAISNVSIEISQPSCGLDSEKQTNWYYKETLQSLMKRTQSLESSFNLIFEEYLQKPLV